MTTIQEAVDAFLKSDPTWAANTRRAYRTALARFLRYLACEERIPPHAPTLALAADLDIPLRYADHLARQSDIALRVSTYQLYLTAVSGYYSHLFTSNVLGQTSAADFQRLLNRLHQKQGVSLKNKEIFLREGRVRSASSREALDRVLQAARDDAAPHCTDERLQRLYELRRLRNIALLEALRSTGARISEILSLNVGDLRPDESALIRRAAAKGEKERVIFFDQRSWFALQVYLAETAASGSSATPVFQRHDRGVGNAVKRLNAVGAQAEIRRLRGLAVRKLHHDLIRLLLPNCSVEAEQRLVTALETAADDALPPELAEALRAQPAKSEEAYQLRMLIREIKSLTAHTFRHAMASLLLDKTGDLAATQDILGHADPRTTRRYAKLSSARLRQVHRQALE